MKVKLSEIVQAVEAMKVLIKKEVPISTSFNLILITRELNPILSSYSDAHKNLVTKYGKENKDGNLEVLPENINKFMEEFNQLLSEEVEVNIKKIKFSELRDISISPDDLGLLLFLIDKEE